VDLIAIASWCSLAAVCLALGLVLTAACGPAERPVPTWVPAPPANAHPAWAALDRKKLRANALAVHRELEEIRAELAARELAGAAV
jgi:hypothetical protein